MTLYNSTFRNPGKPMERTGFNQSAHKSSLKAGKKRLRSRGPKMTPIRKSAKGEDCTVNLPLGVCNYLPETTVLAHENSLASGKGMGLKVPDTRAAYCCSACHDVVDGRAPRPEGLSKEQVDACFERGIEKTQAILRRKGLLGE